MRVCPAPPGPLPISAIMICCAVGRRSGSLTRQAAISRCRSAGTPSSDGGSCITRLITATTVSSPNGGCPVAANTIVVAQAHTSTASVRVAPATCSGAM